MKFVPKKTKFKKSHKGHLINIIRKPRTLNYILNGSVCLKSLEAGRVTVNQLEGCRKTLNRLLRRQGQITFKVFPHTPVSKKPLEIRMGKGKGAVNSWVANITSGTVILEIECRQPLLALKALEAIKSSFSFTTKIVVEN